MRDNQWLQGPIPMVDSNKSVKSIGNTFLPRQAAESNCIIGNTRVKNCRSGDHAYATSTVSGSAQIFKANQSRAKRDAIGLDHFTASSTGLLTIIASRPPAKNDKVNKVGRTTGWTEGEVKWASGGSADPACPGGPAQS